MKVMEKHAIYSNTNEEYSLPSSFLRLVKPLWLIWYKSAHLIHMIAGYIHIESYMELLFIELTIVSVNLYFI